MYITDQFKLFALINRFRNLQILNFLLLSIDFVTLIKYFEFETMCFIRLQLENFKLFAVFNRLQNLDKVLKNVYNGSI